MLLPRSSAWTFLLMSFCSINAFVGLTPIYAQTIEGSAPQPLPPQPTPMMQEFGLTPQQVEQLSAIFNQYRDQIAQTDEELRKAEQELEALMTSPIATENEVKDKFLQVESLRQKFSALRFESRFAMRGVLTPQQRPAFLEKF